MTFSQLWESSSTAVQYVAALPLPVQIHLCMTAACFWGYIGLYFTVPSPVAQRIFALYFLQRLYFFWALLWWGGVWTQWTSTIAATTTAMIVLYVLYVNPIVVLQFRSEEKR